MNIRTEFRLLLQSTMIVMLAFSSGAQAAGKASIGGAVTDNAGKPVRGAIVKATLGGKTYGVYTDDRGQYRISGMERGEYDVVVDAFGFVLAEKSAEAGRRSKVDFELTPGMEVSRLHGSELRYLFPDEGQEKTVYYSCAGCHGIETVVSRAGMPAVAWLNFLPHMTEQRWGHQVGFPPQMVARLVPALVEVVGPDGMFRPDTPVDLDKVKIAPLNEEALKASLVEYSIPSSGAMPHSVTVDDNNGVVWFSEYDAQSNNLVKFDPATETFHEFPNPVPAAHAHTGAVLKDGRFVVALDIGTFSDSPDSAGKIAIVSPDGEIEIFSMPDNPHGARVVEVDPVNEDFVWVVAETELWHFNPDTKEIKIFQNPIAETYPEGSYGGQNAPPGATPHRVNSFGYDIAIDSKGVPWVTQLNLGRVFRVDPKTGETKIYHTPEISSARGMDVDADDNLWVADFFGHKFAKLDTKSGKFTVFEPPSRYASPYGVTVDDRRGYVWYGDTNGNNATRFDPRTGEFVEYPLLTPNAAVRFMGVDPKGRVWYGGFYNSQLGMIDPGY